MLSQFIFRHNVVLDCGTKLAGAEGPGKQVKSSSNGLIGVLFFLNNSGEIANTHLTVQCATNNHNRYSKPGGTLKLPVSCFSVNMAN